MAESIAQRERGNRHEDAEELRRAASTVHSSSLRELLHEIADEYERAALARKPSGSGRD